jgi:hypothetical protein
MESRDTSYVAAGQLPPGTRARLADALFDALKTSGRRHVQVTLPIGDAELPDCIRTRCAGGQARAAGTTCLFEAALPPTRRNRQK